VSKTGTLIVTPGAGVGIVELTGAQALAFAAWITTTFG
jgi:hypothetical protein